MLGVGRRHKPRKLLYGERLLAVCSIIPRTAIQVPMSACPIKSSSLLKRSGLSVLACKHTFTRNIQTLNSRLHNTCGCMSAEDAGDYVEEDPFSHKRPRKSNYYEWKVRCCMRRPFLVAKAALLPSGVWS